MNNPYQSCSKIVHQVCMGSLQSLFRRQCCQKFHEDQYRTPEHRSIDPSPRLKSFGGTDSLYLFQQSYVWVSFGPRTVVLSAKRETGSWCLAATATRRWFWTWLKCGGPRMEKTRKEQCCKAEPHRYEPGLSMRGGKAAMVSKEPTLSSSRPKSESTSWSRHSEETR